MNGDKCNYEKHLVSLKKLVDLHSEIKDIDISLSKLYPVAIVENNNFIIFDFNEKLRKYFFVKKCSAPMTMPEGVKAAFDLQEYENKMAAVLSEDTFDTEKGYVFAFHEFVHCYQGTCEQKLKSDLGVYQDAMKKKDYMWEMQYSFPYEDKTFIEKTKALDMYFDATCEKRVNEYYEYMKNYLDCFDFEYMIWQQWKEGYARYIENKIRVIFGLEKNSQEITYPFNRVSFYEIGSRYIDFILRTKRELRGNVEGVFREMLKI
ncbi:MAG: hypothetical protein FH761_18955 [Firmicutes bacterium]|nr:hypothetical protein [Bacillota bacterium]